MTEDTDYPTITFIANYRIDPDEVDLRVREPSKIRQELREAAVEGGTIQEVLNTDEESLQQMMKKVKDAKE